MVAPAALSVRDTLYVLQSATEPRPILFSTAPATGQLDFYNRRPPRLTWAPVRGAVGYNVLRGIGPAKLYQTHQVFADRGTTLELRALTVGQEYFVAIEAFDENGVSRASAPVRVP
jgi:hypothetical protein